MKLIIENEWPENRNQTTQPRNDNICGQCGSMLQNGEKYCRCCGTRRGVGVYVPEPVDPWDIECIYAPPIKRTHKCTACAYQWDSFEMRNTNKYCPRCGASAETIYDDYRDRIRKFNNR